MKSSSIPFIFGNLPVESPFLDLTGLILSLIDVPFLLLALNL